jgi:hypothetical protein
MWFAKWFGGRREAKDTDEPARFASQAVAKPVVPARAVISDSGKPGARAHQEQGFDPYNSGAFERRNAWERVGRR